MKLYFTFIKNIFCFSCHVAMPKLTDEGYRVNFIKLLHSNVDDYDPYDISAHSTNLFEARLLKDVLVGDIYIIDMSKITLGHASKITPVHIKKLFVTPEVRLFNWKL